MSNADSATNMLWLINQATAGDITNSGTGRPAAAATAPEKKEAPAAAGSGDGSFNNFKIDMNA
jgi:hypothetical protein